MLEIKNLKIKYPDGNEAVKGIDLMLKDGEKAALIGANGAGKSTLLLGLLGMLPFAKGSVSVNGTAVEKKTLPQIRQTMGLVFQNPDDQIFMTSVYEDIAFGPKNYGLDTQEIETRVNVALGHLDIGHLRDRLPNKLSGGEKRLVAIAGVLALKPQIILFDEPTSFLDPRARRNLLPILKELPTTCLIATHDLPMVLDVCDRTIILKDGKIAADGPSRELLSDEELLVACGL